MVRSFSLPNGERRMVSINASPMLDEAGSLRGAILTFNDITAAHEAQAKLRESEQRYRALFEQNPSGVGTTDLEGRILTANPAMLRIIGRRSLREIVGRSIEEFVAPEDVEKAREILRAVTHGTPRTTQVDLIAADGSRVRVEAAAIPIVVDGKLVGVHGVVTPITREKPE